MSFILYAEKNRLTVREREPVTSGSINVYPVRFNFSEDWEDMDKIACFRSGSQIISLPLDQTGECHIPWEVMEPDDKGKKLFAGLYGTHDGSVVLPTVWTCLGEILEGTSFGQTARPPSPNLWEQRLSQKQDKIAGNPGQLAGFDENGQLTALDIPEDAALADTATDEEVAEMLDEVFHTLSINQQLFELKENENGLRFGKTDQTEGVATAGGEN